MAKPKRTRYVPIYTPDEVDIDGLVAQKLFYRLNWPQYMAIRKESGMPIFRNKMQHRQREILTHFHSEPFQAISGGYFPVQQLADNMYEMYSHNNAIGAHPLKSGKHLDFILSFDNRHIFGDNEVFHLRPADVVKAQSSVHVQPFAIVGAAEDNDTLKTVAAELKLNEFLQSFEQYFYDTHGISANLLISADWMALVADLQCARPATRDINDAVCWGCGATRGHITVDWLKDPFQFTGITRTIEDWPNAALWGIPVDKRRYDWLHGINNLLSNTIKEVYEQLPSYGTTTLKAFRELISEVHKNWDEESTLRPVEMKKFFQLGYHLKIAAFFDDTLVDLLWPNDSPPLRLTRAQAIHMLFDSLRVYYEYAYKEFPLPGDLHTLWTARTCIISYYASYSFPQKPTTHYMTNEAIWAANIDKRVYHYLQEGAEKCNDEDKRDARNTMKGTLLHTSGENCHQQILNQHQLRRYLIENNRAPESHRLLPITNYESEVTRLPIAYPHHSLRVMYPY